MAKQQTTPTNRKEEMIYCERCGEDYSATYRRCPFCDERPGRRIDDYGYASRSPLRLVVLIGSLVLILAAAFIVFSKVAPLLTNKEPAVEAPGTNVEEPLTPKLPSVSEPVPEPANPNAVPANAVVLSRTDMTLAPSEKFSILATVAPANTTDTLVVQVAYDETTPGDIATGTAFTPVITNRSPFLSVVTSIMGKRPSLRTYSTGSSVSTSRISRMAYSAPPQGLMYSVATSYSFIGHTSKIFISLPLR